MVGPEERDNGFPKGRSIVGILSWNNNQRTFDECVLEGNHLWRSTSFQLKMADLNEGAKTEGKPLCWFEVRFWVETFHEELLWVRKKIC